MTGTREWPLDPENDLYLMEDLSPKPQVCEFYQQPDELGREPYALDEIIAQLTL